MAKKKKGTSTDGSWLEIDPRRIRFQHSRIRPYFSGCGRSVEDTLQVIREGKLDPRDLPPIQVLVGPDDWYFSLNNRRLWVLKRCREEGLLETIRVRVRAPKSAAEATRYTVENCALEAKLMRESAPKEVSEAKNHTVDVAPKDDIAEKAAALSLESTKDADDDEESDSDDSDTRGYQNPFAALS